MKKFLIILAIIIYDASPIDLFPGPIDDAIVTILGFLWTKAMTKTTSVMTDSGEVVEKTEPIAPASSVIKRVNKNTVHRSEGPKKMGDL